MQALRQRVVREDIIGGEALYHEYTAGVLYGGNGDDLVLGGGPDESHGGNGNDKVGGGIVWGGSGSDSFYFRGAVNSGIEGYFSVAATTSVKAFQAGERILLDGVRVTPAE